MESGLLELYVLGDCTEEEMLTVELMAANSPEIKAEIDAIAQAFELYAYSEAVAPDPAVKPFLLATVDYAYRLSNGEAQSFPPELNAHSLIGDYAEWLNRPDMILPDDFKDFYAKIIGYTPEAVTAIMWIKEKAPTELHTDVHEKFLVIEGNCDIEVNEKNYSLTPGNYIAIPLYMPHHLTVTSANYCKVILQRIAA